MKFLLKFIIVFLILSVGLNAGSITWSAVANAPLDKNALIVMFGVILLIGLWFSKKAPTSVKISLVSLILVSGVYKYKLEASSASISLTSLSGTSTFDDSIPFMITNDTGVSLNITITPSPGYSCPSTGCKYSFSPNEAGYFKMVVAN